MTIRGEFMSFGTSESNTILEGLLPQIEHYAWEMKHKLKDREFVLICAYAPKESELITTFTEVFQEETPYIELEKEQEIALITCMPPRASEKVADQQFVPKYKKDTLEQPAPAGKLKLFLITEKWVSFAYVTPRSHLH